MARKTNRNVIVTKELWSQVNEDNKEVLNEFLEYLNSTDKSELTIINYESDIKICFIWALQNIKNKFFVDFTKRDIMKYQNYLLNTLELSPNRVRRAKSSISSMSNFIETILDEDYPKFKNIVNKIPAPIKQEVREKTILEDNQIDSLLKHLVEQKEYQKACALALAVGSGARKSEILRFKTHYFSESNIIYNSLYKTPEKIKTKGRGRGGKMLYKYTIKTVFEPYFTLWMKEREELGIDSEYLFVVKRKGEWKPAATSTLDSWAKTFTKILGVDFYWHCNRHYWTSHLRKSNLPDKVILKLQGWESADMINLYDDNDIDDELGQYFDENGVKEVESKNITDL